LKATADISTQDVRRIKSLECSETLITFVRRLSLLFSFLRIYPQCVIMGRFHPSQNYFLKFLKRPKHVATSIGYVKKIYSRANL